MTAVATLAGAPTYEAMDWFSIDWQKVNRNVRRLQARIVKAIGSTAASYHRAFERLEPCALKGARTVPRGPGASNGSLLPDPQLIDCKSL